MYSSKEGRERVRGKERGREVRIYRSKGGRERERVRTEGGQLATRINKTQCHYHHLQLAKTSIQINNIMLFTPQKPCAGLCLC